MYITPPTIAKEPITKLINGNEISTKDIVSVRKLIPNIAIISLPAKINTNPIITAIIPGASVIFHHVNAYHVIKAPTIIKAVPNIKFINGSETLRSEIVSVRKGYPIRVRIVFPANNITKPPMERITPISS